MRATPIGEPPPRGEELFPLVRLPPTEPDVFELALVLGGTLSAGAYTAGALDFLLQALEAWHGQPNPPHRLRIPFVTGSSGGAVCAAMLAVMTRGPVPHAPDDFAAMLTKREPRGNPLWNLWVNEYDITNLLGNSDLRDNARLFSLFNTTLLDRMETELVAFAERTEGSPPSYFPKPFRLAVTLTNMRGVPYRMDAPGVPGLPGTSYLQHDDYARFAVPNGADPAERRPDEFWVVRRSSWGKPGIVGYQQLARYATASGAAPGVLKARELTRPIEHYLYRPRIRPVPCPIGYTVDWTRPDWAAAGLGTASGYGFTACDGGLFNDEPVRLAHEALAGLVGLNQRRPERARQALLMIHPLAQKPAPLPQSRSELLAVLPRLLNLLVDGARYETADMSLFGSRAVFSRFHLAPWRNQPDFVGPDAVVGSRFHGLAGFFGRPWRVHDFLLGRANMRNFIRRAFVLRGDNPLFRRWDSELCKQFAVREDGEPALIDAHTPRCDYYLPVLPDLTPGGPPAPREIPIGATLPWPRAKLASAPLNSILRKRLSRAFRAGAIEALPGIGGWLAGTVLAPMLGWGAGHAIVAQFRAEMIRSGLLSRMRD